MIPALFWFQPSSSCGHELHVATVIINLNKNKKNWLTSWNYPRCGSALESSDIWEAADTFGRSPWAGVPGMSSWGNPEVCTLENNVEGRRALAFQGHLLEEQDDIGGKRKDRASLLQLVPPPPGQQWAEEEKRWRGGQRSNIPALFLCFWVVFGGS